MQAARDSGKKVLANVNRIVRDRIKAKRHVFIEQPRGSEWLQQPETKDIQQMLTDGVLVRIEANGCQLGYFDKDSGLPHCKPTSFVTTMFVAESIFASCRCPRDHRHQTLEGSNTFGRRTLQAATWPDELNRKVLDCILQQAVVEATANENAKEAFPAELQSEQQSTKRRRRGKMSILRDDQNAPPVYMRPDLAFEPVQPQTEDDPTLAELIGISPREVEVMPGDDSSSRAAQAATLQPILNMTEADRRHRWLQVKADIRKVLRDLHVQFGHPTTTMMRILRRMNAKPEVIYAAQFLACDSCGESIRRRRPKPTRLPSKYVFNHHLLLDTFYAKDVKATMYSFLNIVDDATGFQVVCVLGQAVGPPSTRAVLKHFIASWSSWAGLPQSLQVDQGKEYLAAFANYLKEWGVEQEAIPLEAPWKGGRCERAGATWKEIFNRTVVDMQLEGLDDIQTAAGIITQCRNSFPRTSGFAPNQWVLGSPGIRLPGSLLNSVERDHLEVLEAAEDPQSAMARSLVGIREAARVAQVRLDTDGRIRRALLHKSTPTRGPFPVGSYVYFYRMQTQPGQARNYKWHGPARVIGVELRNQRRMEDPEPSTDGGQPHSYWLRFGPSVVLVTGEQLRFASEDELLAAHAVPQEALEPPYARGARSLVDFRPPGFLRQQGDQAPLPSVPEPLPQSGGAISSAGPSRTSTSTIPGTDLPVIPETLPPLPEDPPDGGALEDLGQPVPEYQQEVRTGAPIEQGMSRRTSEVEPEPQPPSTTMSLTANAPQAETSMDMEASSASQNQEGRPPPQQPPRPSSASNSLRDPDRLDGYHPVIRGRRSEMQSPYLTEHDLYLNELNNPWSCPSLPDTLVEHNLKRMANEHGYIDSDEDNTSSNDENKITSQNPADVFLTGSAVRSEIKLKDLGPEDREKFDQSMAQGVELLAKV